MSGRARGWATAGLAVAAGLLALVAFGRTWGRSYTAGTWDITIAWGLGVACVVALAVLGRRPGPAPDAADAEAVDVEGERPRRRLTPETVAGLWILGMAAAVRFVALWRLPTVIDGDEGIHVQVARAARDGTLPNPWTTSIFTAADGSRAVAGKFALLFGDGIGSYRAFSAVLGTLSVLAVWRFGRRAFGEVTGLVAMGIVAFVPMHVWASRSAITTITHAAIVPVVLWLVDRAVTEGRRADALGAGLAVGLGMYGYFGGTVFGLIAVAVVVVAVASPAYRVGVRAGASIVGWIVLAAVVVAAPLLGHYAHMPERYTGRFEEVRSDGGTFERIESIGRAALLPVSDRSTHEDFYRVDGPFLGLVVGPLAVAGVAVWAWWVLRRWRAARRGDPVPPFRAEPTLAAWVILTVAVGQTSTLATQRWLGATPLWSLAAACSLVAAGRWIVARSELRRGAVLAIGAVVIAAVGLANVARYFDEGQQRRAYGDNRTTGADDLGRRMAGAPDVRVLSLGRPFQPYTAFGNLQFLVPDWRERMVEVESLVTPEAAGVSAPVLAQGEVAAIAAERVATDACPMALANPEASFYEVRDRYGALLYVLVAPGELPFSDAEQITETTLEPVVRPC